jgi:lipoic acid synthetase
MSRQIPVLDPSGTTTRARLPAWFKVNVRESRDYQDIRRLTGSLKLHTICEEARCPNIWECWNNRTATFLILGDICTRRCHYCSVTTGRPLPLDTAEPARVAEAVNVLGLRHAVITSVNRDELPDGGAGIFAETIMAIRRSLPSCTIEVLIPDFMGDESALERVLAANPDILNHNIETVPRLFASVRPQGKYLRSIRLLEAASQKGAVTKSGVMVGLGETVDEVREVMQDLRAAGCAILSIGQYLQPSKGHWPVLRFYEPLEFQQFKEEGLALGFRHVESGPLVRSSYHAEQQASSV